MIFTATRMLAQHFRKIVSERAETDWSQRGGWR